MIEEVKALPFVITSHPTGSNYVCSPPVTNTDRDFVVLVNSVGHTEVVLALSELGYVWGAEADKTYGPGQEMMCFRKGVGEGSINLIVVKSPSLYSKWLAATEVAKSLNLLEKGQRVKLFQYVLYGTIR